MYSIFEQNNHLFKKHLILKIKDQLSELYNSFRRHYRRTKNKSAIVNVTI
jgi:hypothetical protein